MANRQPPPGGAFPYYMYPHGAAAVGGVPGGVPNPPGGGVGHLPPPPGGIPPGGGAVPGGPAGGAGAGPGAGGPGYGPSGGVYGMPVPPGAPAAAVPPPPPPTAPLAELGAPTDQDGPLAHTFFANGPSDPETLADRWREAWDFQTGTRAVHHQVLMQLGTQPGCQLYFVVLRGSNQNYFAMLGCIQWVPGVPQSNWERHLVLTLGELRGGLPSVFSRVPDPARTNIGRCRDVRLWPLATVIQEYNRHQRSPTEAHPPPRATTAGTSTSRVPYVAPCPPAWAFRFLREGSNLTPFRGLMMVAELMETLPSHQRTRILPLADWFRAACTSAANNSTDSCLQVEHVLTLPDADAVGWWQAKFGPLQSQAFPAPPSTTPGVSFSTPGAAPAGGRSTAPPATAAGAAGVAPTAPPVPAPQAPAATTPSSESPAHVLSGDSKGRLSAEDKIHILGWMGGKEDDEVTPFWKGYQKRTVSLTNMRNLIYECTVVPDSALSIVDEMYVPPNAAKDIRDQAFGLGMEMAYARFHRRFTPFGWVPLGQDKCTDLDLKAKAHDTADHRTVADQEREPKEGAAVCPASGPKVRLALANYLCGGLMPIFGGDGEHQWEVAAIVKAMKKSLFKNITELECLMIMWEVFLNARQYFGTLWDTSSPTHEQETRPTSQLSSFRENLQKGAVVMTWNLIRPVIPFFFPDSWAEGEQQWREAWKAIPAFSANPPHRGKRPLGRQTRPSTTRS